MNQVAKH
jgi:predicted MFS family arabinose efflux permease